MENSSLRPHSFQRRMKLENHQVEDQGKLQIVPLGIHMLLFVTYRWVCWLFTLLHAVH